MITFPPHIISVDTPHGSGMVIYVDSQLTENDIWCVGNMDDGKIRHYQSTQITLASNYTFDINTKPQNFVEKIIKPKRND